VSLQHDVYQSSLSLCFTCHMRVVFIGTRDMTELANIRIGCGFHVQNPSDSDAEADLLRDQNYYLL